MPVLARSHSILYFSFRVPYLSSFIHNKASYLPFLWFYQSGGLYNNNNGEFLSLASYHSPQLFVSRRFRCCCCRGGLLPQVGQAVDMQRYAPARFWSAGVRHVNLRQVLSFATNSPSVLNHLLGFFVRFVCAFLP